MDAEPCGWVLVSFTSSPSVPPPPKHTVTLCHWLWVEVSKDGFGLPSVAGLERGNRHVHCIHAPLLSIVKTAFADSGFSSVLVWLMQKNCC